MSNDVTDEIVDKRRGVYGEVVPSFTRVAEVWSGIIGHHINPADVPLMMIGLKLVRTQITPDYSDNSDDVDGYLEIFREIIGDDMIHARTVDQYLEQKYSQENPAALMPEPMPGMLAAVNGVCATCLEPEALHEPLTRECQRTGFAGCFFNQED